MELFEFNLSTDFLSRS